MDAGLSLGDGGGEERGPRLVVCPDAVAPEVPVGNAVALPVGGA